MSLDHPSGVGGNGQIYTPAVQADATLTLSLPKVGLIAEEAGAYVGELYLADISVPPGLYTHSGLDIQLEPLFAKEEIIRLK